MAANPFYAVVPAGGAGTRLWPLSRASHPKFLLDLTGTGQTLLQGTIDRLATLVDQTLVVTGQAHAAAVSQQVPDVEVLVEPAPKDSMAAIGLAAAVLVHRHPSQDVMLGSFAADHVVADQEAFTAALDTAIGLAERDYVVAIGVEADSPSTAFGYIELGQPLADGAYQVAAFTEKPDEATARAYLATGRYRWNAGMYLMRGRVLLTQLQRLQPELAQALLQIGAAWDTPEREATLQRLWPTLPRIAIDHAISEPLAEVGAVAVVPASLGWNDVGDWRSLSQVLPAGASGAHMLTGAGQIGPDADRDLNQATVLDSDGAVVVAAAGRRVVLVGMPDAVVVDTPDALLVTTTDQAQQVKAVVEQLAADGDQRLL
ncbi:MAG: mannose-1-phosphate guanylyltransferase [Beutenbergiaceae bacterium]